MKRSVQRLGTVVILSCLLVVMSSPTVHATVQDESCIAPDIEYPVPCEDED